MNNGVWIKDPKAGTKVAGVRGPDGVAVPLDQPAPKKPTKAKEK